jgi:hypothetical protein
MTENPRPPVIPGNGPTIAGSPWLLDEDDQTTPATDDGDDGA